MGKQIEGENWRDWIKEWGGRFLLFARQQTNSAEEAEDILQEAFVHIWNKRDQFARIDPGLVFLQLKRVAINQARKESRRRQREDLYSRQQPAFFLPKNNAFATEVDRALAKLPIEQREVIILKVWGEQTFESIARSLEISPNTAASRYRYGLDRLRRVLEGEIS